MSEASLPAKAPQIGWLCSLVPEEIILAGGLHPVRLRGQAESIKMADLYISANLCPYLKNFMESGLRGEFSDLTGLILAHTCDGLRRLADLWSAYVDTPARLYRLEVPRNRSAAAISYFADQLETLASSISHDFGIEIAEAGLKQAIEIMNERRRLMAKIFAGQKEVPARLSGSQLWALLSDETTRPKNETTELLKQAAARPASLTTGNGHQPRIMVMGNLMHQPTLLEMMEQAGGSAVVIDNCQGWLHYDEFVPEDLPPFHALASRYLLRPSCARMPGFEDRLTRLGGMIREYRIQGVIYSSLKFCDYSLFEIPLVEKCLQESRVPFLSLENDYLWKDTGRLRVRLEAFLEMIRDDTVDPGTPINVDGHQGPKSTA